MSVKLILAKSAGGGGGSGTGWDGVVATYADLPDPTTVSGKYYLVQQASGIWPFRKSAGIWYSNGSTWAYMGNLTLGSLGDVNTSTGKTTPIDADTVLLYDSTDSVWKNLTWANLKATLKTYFDTVYATASALLGKKPYHGIETAGAVSWTGNVFTLARSGGTIKYWYKGTSYTKTDADITVALTPTNNVLYYIYFADATGVLTATTNLWSIQNDVLVATCFYNGTTMAVVSEKHGYNRSLDWHLWAHLTIGARYQSGLALSGIGGSGTGVTWTIASGTVLDEDLSFTVSQHTQTTPGARKWRPTSASAVTFEDSAYPFFWNSGTSRVQYVDASYALQDHGNSNNYINVWAYAMGGDTARQIYFFTPPIANVYGTLAAARAAAPPDLSAYGMNPEMKLLYRLVISGGASPAIQATVAGDDFRTSSTVPSGGTTTPTAASVSFSPNENISATNVQAAIATGTLLNGGTIYLVNSGNAITGATAIDPANGLVQKVKLGGNYAVYAVPPSDTTKAYRMALQFEQDATGSRVWSEYVNMQSCTASTDDTITLNGHGFPDGCKVKFAAGTIPTGLTAGTIYYVRDSATNTFKVAATRGGAAIDITSAGATVTVGRCVLSLGGLTSSGLLTATAGSKDEFEFEWSPLTLAFELMNAWYAR